MPESQQVDVRSAVPDLNYPAYRFNEVPVSQEKRQQGWRRWISNAGADGIANSWEELNIKTGEYRYIGINGQVSQGQCSQEKWLATKKQASLIFSLVLLRQVSESSPEALRRVANNCIKVKGLE